MEKVSTAEWDPSVDIPILALDEILSVLEKVFDDTFGENDGVDGTTAFTFGGCPW